MIVRASVAWQVDSLLPRDVVMITPHFSNAQLGGGADWQDFADDLAASMLTYAGGNKPTRVKIYDAQGSPPVYPVGDASAGPTTAPNSGAPREVALCLSYYSGRNVGRQRGRLYVPAAVAEFNGPALRPTSTQMDKVGSLAQLLADAGGADTDWVVYSRADDEARSVSNWWVDDEWDTMRSRGLRATTRLTGTVGE